MKLNSMLAGFCVVLSATSCNEILDQNSEQPSQSTELPNQAPVINQINISDSIANQVVFSPNITDENNNTLVYFWEFGDDESSSEFAPTYRYAQSYDDEIYTGSLSVLDDAGLRDKQTFNVFIPAIIEPINTAPVIHSVLASDQVNNEVLLTVHATDEEDTQLNYFWEFPDGSTSSAVSPSYVFAQSDVDRNYVVQVRVSDSQALSSVSSVEVFIPAVTPVIEGTVPTFDPQVTVLDTGEIQFQANAQDADLDQLTYVWQINDDVSVTNESGNYFFELGLVQVEHQISLTVEDEDANRLFKQIDIIIPAKDIEQFAPQVNPVHVESQPGLINFFANAFDKNDDALTYLWNFGDGQSSINQDPIHQYAITDTDQNFQVTLSVTDQLEVVSISFSVTILAEVPSEFAPTSDIELTVSDDGLVGFVANAQDLNNDVLSYAWDFGDGSVSNLANPTYQYNLINVAQIFNVTLTVIDDTQLSSTQTVSVVVPALTVIAYPPTADPIYLIGENAQVQFAANASDQNGDALTYIWDFGDNQFSNEENPIHSYAQNDQIQQFVVTLTVQDSTNLSIQATNLIEIPALVEINTPPLVSVVESLQVEVNEQFTLNALALDSEQEVLSYLWELDSQSFNVPSIDYSFANSGIYQAVLRVSDGEYVVQKTVEITVGTVENLDENITFIRDEAQMSISEINNCGVNAQVLNSDIVLLSQDGVEISNVWNHITSTFGEWEGIAKQALEYNISTSLNSQSVACNNELVHSNILVKKYSDWDLQHANGFYLNINNNVEFSQLETMVLDIYVDSENSVLPTMQELYDAFDTLMSTEDIEELDDGKFYLELTFATTSEYIATVKIALDTDDLDKWLRIEIPAEQLYAWEVIDYQRQARTHAQMANQTITHVMFLAETASGYVYRNYDAGFDENTAPKLFKEEAIELRYVGVNTNQNNEQVNTAPTVEIGLDQSVSVNDLVEITPTVNDVDGDSLEYSWQIDGQSFSSDELFSYQFDEVADYEISLSVSDGQSTSIDSLIVSVISNCTQDTAVSLYGDLYVDGAKIKGCDAQVVQLRGVSNFWSQWSSQYYNSSVVDTLVDDWNANIIRAAMGVDTDLGGYANASNKAAELANVTTMIDAAIAKGVYVIVDFHTHYAEDYVNEAKEFFTYIAQTYGNHPNIIYEIYNEPLNGPNYSDDSNWWASTIKPYAEEIIPVIRAIDSDNLIIVGTRTWSQRVDEAANNPITGYENIAYTIHFYADTHGQEIRDYVQYAIDSDIAVFATEWGMTHANGGTQCPNGNHDWDACASDERVNDNYINISETQNWLDFLDANDISWLNWALMDKDESSSALIPGASSVGSWSSSDLSPSGTWIRNRLRSY